MRYYRNIKIRSSNKTTINHGTKTRFSRRNFISHLSFGSVATLGSNESAAFLFRTGTKPAKTVSSVMLDQAPDGKVIRAGLVGCGGRIFRCGHQFVDADQTFDCCIGRCLQDKMASRGPAQKQRNIEVPDEKCFVGFDSYRKYSMQAWISSCCAPLLISGRRMSKQLSMQEAHLYGETCAVDPVGARSFWSLPKRQSSLDCQLIAAPSAGCKDYVETHRRLPPVDQGRLSAPM